MNRRVGRAFQILILGGFVSHAVIVSQNPDEEMARQLRSGHPTIDVVEIAKKSKDARVVKALEELFDLTGDPFMKWQLAVHLARQSKKIGNRYFEYLAIPALVAVHDLAPNVEDVDALGIPIPKTRSGRFIQWCSDHNVDVEHQEALELLSYPQSVLALGATEDPRAAVILREGLSSSNRGIAYSAAYGLAIIGEVEDVQLIINLAEQQPAKLQFLFGAMLSRVTQSAAQVEIKLRLRPGSVLEESYKRALESRSHEK